jgi:cytochrome c-type biogenesis protein CcmH/NrfF
MIGLFAGLALLTPVPVQMLTYRLIADPLERTLLALWAPPAVLLLASLTVLAGRSRNQRHGATAD